MQRNLKFSIGEYYHIFNRGINKDKVFLSQADYERFLVLLYLSNTSKKIHLSDLNKKSKVDLFNIERKDTLVDIGAYCILPNHFHLLVKEKVEGGISKFMSKLLTSYSMYFNKKKNRSGALFCRPFRAQYVNDDNYLKYLFAYIHLNVFDIFKKGWRENINLITKKDYENLIKYKYSSYPDYYQIKRVGGNILNKEAFQDYFESNPELFKDFIDEWLLIKKEVCQGVPLG